MSLEMSNILYWASDVLATSVERNFRPEPYLEFASKNYAIPFGLVSLYMAGCYIGSIIMKNRKAYDLRFPLAMWNAFLCVFSFLGMCRTVPYLLASVLSKPYEETVCSLPMDSWGSGTSGFWVMLFIFSKIPELIDTLFIVLRKKPLIFLHWYHHVTVLLFCWNSFASTSGSGLYFVAMNYSVHAVMYGYYCLQALGVCPKSFPTILITISQIAQMFIGTGVCISAWYYSFYSTNTCHNDMSNLIAGALMYGSYLYLFVDFAFGRYLRGSSKKHNKAVKSL